MRNEPDSADAGEPTPDSDARVAELEARCVELETRWLRAQADYQNVRRRAQQELESALLRTLQPLLDELLLVIDYLDLALSAPVTNAETRALVAGVAMTRTKLVAALELSDVRLVPATGLFDPALHEAAESRVSDASAPGTILASVRPGYTWQGRILRPARVVVAAAPENASRESERLTLPTYEYRCEACEHELELFQNISESPKKKCPACKKQKLKRKIGGGAGFLFKGSGFYLTDYRSDSYKKAADADSKAPDAKPTDSKPADAGASSTSDAKGDKKPAAPAAEKRARDGKKKSK